MRRVAVRCAWIAAVAMLAYVLAAKPAVALAADPCARKHYEVVRSSAAYGSDPRYETLDLYVPAGANGEPLAVFMHGGGWSHGDKAQYAPLGSAFAACGIAIAAIDYPLAPQAHVDAQAQSVARALRWLIDHPPAGVTSASHRFLMGHDTGAELAVLTTVNPAFLGSVSLNPSMLTGVIALDGIGYNPSELASAAAANPSAYHLYLDAFGPDVTKWQNDDCSRYLGGPTVRYLIVRGIDDTTASEHDSAELFNQLQRAGAAVTFMQPEGRDHNGVLVNLVQTPDDPTRIAIERFVLGG